MERYRKQKNWEQKKGEKNQGSAVRLLVQFHANKKATKQIHGKLRRESAQRKVSKMQFCLISETHYG